MLNVQQQFVKDKLDLIMKKQSGGICLISGVGGVGKTYTISIILQESGIPPEEICVCAPTDKALEVVSQNLEFYPAKTIHSLLGYYPSSDHNGKQWLNAILDKEVPYRIVVLDEAYCTPNIILQAMWERRDILWICLGDGGQLKAIGDNSSLLDEMELLFEYELTIQERSRGTCFPIIQEIRDKGSLFIPEFTKSNVFLEKFYTALEEGKDATYLAFHNKVINEVARKARLRLYEQAEDIPIVGEKVRVKMLTNDQGEKIIHSNAIVEVVDVDQFGMTVMYRNNWVYCPFLRYEGFHTKPQYEGHLSEVQIAYNIAKDKTGKTKKESARDWNKYYNIVNSFVRWSFPNVSTVHSYQGSTTDLAFINWADLAFCRTDPNIQYSAASRARDYVYFCK
jgi:exodeoxyribonuclease-5